MTPVKQTIESNKQLKIKGNCLQACVASLLDLPLEQVPHFVSFSDDEWVNIFLDFIYAKGYICEGYAPFSEINNESLKSGVDDFFIVTGQSPRGIKHAVIYKKDQMFHDPHISNSGLIKLEGFYLIKKGPGPMSNPWRLFF